MTYKRGYDRINISTLREALELVEDRGIATTMNDAVEIWTRISAFRPAQVLFATEFIAPTFFGATLSEKVQGMISEHLVTFHEISDCRELLQVLPRPTSCSETHAMVPNCGSSTASYGCQKKRGKQKLSYFSELISVLMKYTHVSQRR